MSGFLNSLTLRVLIVAVLAMGAAAFFKKQQAEEDRQTNLRRLELAELEARFQGDIGRAKRATGNPCTSVFFEYVVPPPGLGGVPRLIMMGQEISYVSIDLSAYRLKTAGDRTELWYYLSTPLAADGPRKVGEKFNPENLRCRER
jgi:hypothetical protein